MEDFLKLKDEGKTVFFSTHITSDLEKCADRILFIQQGRLKADDTLEGFRDAWRIAECAGEIPPALKEASRGACRVRDGYTVLIRKEDAGDLADALEAVRWAPSAANRQPWRAVITESGVHFYEQKSIKDSPLGDVQKVDMGIALCHFDLSLEEGGISGSFVFEDPELAVPGNTYYIVSWKRAE